MMHNCQEKVNTRNKESQMGREVKGCSGGVGGGVGGQFIEVRMTVKNR